MSDRFLVALDDSESAFEIRREGSQTFVRREGVEQWQEVTLARVGDSGLHVLTVDNRPLEIYLERRRGGAIVTLGRHVFEANVGPWRPAGARKSATGGKQAGKSLLKAPMTGSIVEVRVAVGDVVEKGDVLLVIESMKMNNELRSPASGTVEAVAVKAGERVKQGDLLVAVHAGGDGAPVSS